ncbi:MAG: flippase-like domain-containing protein [Desulfobacula sp.]|nr:flippase-like domain-containing protein [Desulfobacula sp.]
MKKYILSGVGIGVSFLLLWITLRNYNLDEIGHALLTADIRYLLAGACLILPSFIMRAIRWRFLFSSAMKPSIKSLFLSMMIGYLGNNLLPARGGELIRVYILGKTNGISKSLVFATVLVEKVTDLLILLLLLAAVIWIFPFPAWLVSGGAVIGVFAITALSFLIAIAFSGTRLITFIKTSMSPVMASYTVVKKVENILIGLIDGIKILRRQKNMLAYFLFSGIVWIIEISIVWLIAKSFNLPLSFHEALFVMLVIGIGSLVPSAPGNVGTFEFFTTNAMGLLNILGGSVLAFSLVLHALTFIGALLIGGICAYVSGLKLFSEVNSLADNIESTS